MTFSVLARCDQTGAFGIGIASASVAVGARCPWARSRVGAVATQGRTDPTLGPLILERLAAGLSAAESLDLVLSHARFAQWRQLAVVDQTGAVATHSGSNCASLLGESRGDGVLALGNLLASEAVPSEMRAAFERADGELEERLLASLAEGLRAGGETRPLRSAALVVVAEDQFPRTHLRIDCAADPLDALADLWRTWRMETDACRRWALAPDAS